MLYLVGADQKVQHDGRAGDVGRDFELLRDEFPGFLEGLAERLSVTVIAEESNEDVLTNEATNSVPRAIASKMGIAL